MSKQPPSNFTKFVGTPLQRFVLPIIPAGAKLGPESSLTPDQLGKIPGKWNTGDEAHWWAGFWRWQRHATTADDLKNWDWWQMPPDQMMDNGKLAGPHTYSAAIALGMRCGPESIIAIDIDVKKKEIADWLEARVREILGEPLAVRERVGNDARRQLIYRQKPRTMPITKKALAFTLPDEGGDKQLLEVLGEGQQTVIEGPHASGAMHYWRDEKGLAERSKEGLEAAQRIDDGDILRLTTALAADVNERGGEVLVEVRGGKARDPNKEFDIESQTSPHLLPPDKRNLLTKAIQAIDLNHDSLASYDDWIKLFVAICASVGRDVEYFYNIVLPWLLTYEKNTPEDMEMKWLNAFKTSTLGPEYVYVVAARFGCKEALEEIYRVRAAEAAEAFGGSEEGGDDRDISDVQLKGQITARPVVQVRPGALPVVVDQAEARLIEADPDLFQRGSLIVRPIQDFIPTLSGRQIVGTRLASVGGAHLIDRFSRVIDFQKPGSNGTWVSVDCPKQVADIYLAREGEWQLPVLTRIIRAPTLRADGSILTQPGYDAASGLLFDPQGVTFSPIPSQPSILDAVEARIVLRDLLATFPFVDDTSRAVALSAILTALIRPSLPAAPLHAFTAPVQGSGKSMLADIASMIASGHEAAVIAQGHTAEEFEKRLGACFLAGDAIVAIDNCYRPVEGEFLCQVLTQLRVTIRVLGHSRNVVVPTNATLFATGNNLQIKGDLTRRAIVCSIDPRCEHPELRPFAANPLDLIRRDRPQYVAAALTLLRFALTNELRSDGMPIPLGSFEVWSRWVRAAAIFATDADPCATMERLQTQDPEVERLVSVIHEWQAIIGDRFVTTAEVIDIATKQRFPPSLDEKRFVHDTFREALLAVAGNGGSIDSRRLGAWLGHNKDRIVGGKKIVMGPMLNGINRWQVGPVGGAELPAAA